MTEVGGVTSLSHEEQFDHAASIGRPTPGVEVRIVDDAGIEVKTGEPGELLVRVGQPGRYSVMRGYYNRPEETAKTIKDGWIHTGDVAKADDDGYLYIVDRKKDMVLSGGFNIYTKEVEQALLQNPDVADAAVIGVPDAVFGEAVAAFIERQPGCDPDACVGRRARPQSGRRLQEAEIRLHRRRATPKFARQGAQARIARSGH